MSMSPDEVSNLSVWDLYRSAACGRPDSTTSPGAYFLAYVSGQVAEFWRDLDDVDDFDPDVEASSIADRAPDDDTHTMWQEFVDLSAYEETPTFEWNHSDLNQVASSALFQIAERLALYLFQELKDWHAEQNEDEEDEEDYGEGESASDEW